MYLGGEPMSRVGYMHGSSPSSVALVNKQLKLSVAGLEEILSSDCTYLWHSITAYLYYNTDLVWNKPTSIPWDFCVTIESTQICSLQPRQIDLLPPSQTPTLQ